MQVRIHRGTREIGGTCIELEQDGARLLLDLGLPLDAEPDDTRLHSAIAGLRGGGDLLALILSRGHRDHFGLPHLAGPDLPVALGAATLRILTAAAPFVPDAYLPTNIVTFSDRRPVRFGPFTVTPILVDHSAYDAYALLIEAGADRLLYSGDLRGHGRKAALFERLVRAPPRGVDTLLLEGSCLGRLDPEKDFPSEADIEARFVEAFAATGGLALVAASAQNIDRMVSLYRACKRAGRTLIIDLYAAERTDQGGRRHGDNPGDHDVAGDVPTHGFSSSDRVAGSTRTSATARPGRHPVSPSRHPSQGGRACTMRARNRSSPRMDAMRQHPRLVTVFGGSGFLGRHVVRALARRGYRIRVAVRRPNLALFLQPLGTVGQVQIVQANLRFDRSIARAVERSDVVVNCVGILRESGRQSFEGIQAEGTRAIAAVLGPNASLVHVSALGADPDSPSSYARSKAEGEAEVFAARPDAVVVRPSILFGAGDSFFNRFAALARALPVLPLAGAGTRFQPVFVGDVAEVVARAVDATVPGGRIYELGGPQIRTLAELVDYVLSVTERRRLVLPLPPGLARLQAAVMELADALTLGLLPNDLKLTRDQVTLLQADNVVSEAATSEGRTLEGLGVKPCAMEAIVPAYLMRFRKTGQFDLERAT